MRILQWLGFRRSPHGTDGPTRAERRILKHADKDFDRHPEDKKARTLAALRMAFVHLPDFKSVKAADQRAELVKLVRFQDMLAASGGEHVAKCPDLSPDDAKLALKLVPNLESIKLPGRKILNRALQAARARHPDFDQLPVTNQVAQLMESAEFLGGHLQRPTEPVQKGPPPGFLARMKDHFDFGSAKTKGKAA